MPNTLSITAAQSTPNSRVLPETTQANAAPGLRRVVAELGRVAQTSVPVFISAPPGAPRDALARLVHEQSPWAEGPLEVVSLAHLDGDEAIARVFGGDDQPSSGARQGAFQRARGGTLVIHDIDQASIALQAQLTRALELRSMHKGEPARTSLPVRLVSTSRFAPRDAVQAGHLRPELLYRAAGFSVRIPPLQERPDDIDVCITRTLEDLRCSGECAAQDLTSDAWATMREYDWPGNERELSLVLQRAALLVDGTLIGREHLCPRLTQREQGTSTSALTRALAHDAESTSSLRTIDDYERWALPRALAEADGNVTLAAQLLGIGRATFYRKAKRFGVPLHPEVEHPEAQP